MISFAYPAGLLLLPVIPLLLLLARVRARPRREVLTAFFLLEALRRGGEGRRLRFLRLTSRQRLALAALTLVCLSLALAGTRLRLARPLPERWLVVVDNPPHALRSFGGRSVLAHTAAFLREEVGRLRKEDRVTVLTTSPAPAALTFRPGAELERHLGALGAARDFPSVDAALPAVRDLARHSTRAILISPRADAWREVLRTGAPHARVVVPPDAETARGNTGIVGLRVRPSLEAPGAHDLFLSLAAAGEAPGEVAVEASSGGSPLKLFAPVPLAGGEGSVFLPGVVLPPGELTVSLRLEDALDLDNAATVSVGAARHLAVSVEGGGAGVFETALGTHPGYSLVRPGAADVAVHLGDAPAQLDRPALIVHPSLDRHGLTALGVIDTRERVRWHPDHPVTDGLAGESFRPRRVSRFAADERYEPVAVVAGVPVVLAGESGGHRVVVWAFNPVESKLFLAPEFIMLLRGSLDWLGEPEPERRSGYLSPELTREAAAVTLPRLGRELFAGRRSAAATVDLVPWLLAVTLLAGLVLAATDAAGEREEP